MAMWNTPDIADLQDDHLPVVRPLTGYAINIRPRLMSDDLKPFIVTPGNPARRWADDMGVVNIPPVPKELNRPGKLDFSQMPEAKPKFETVFLVFPDLATAKATSLGQHWQD